MTVSLILFCLFVLGATLTIVLQIFGSVLAGNALGCSLWIVALVVHGSAILVSTITMGWSVYSKQFNCWFESCIIWMDSIALWFSIRNYFLEATKQQQQVSSRHTTIYLSFFWLCGCLARDSDLPHVLRDPETRESVDHRPCQETGHSLAGESSFERQDRHMFGRGNSLSTASIRT